MLVTICRRFSERGGWSMLNDDELIKGPYGKLYLKSNEKYFNISHCDNYALLAIADKDVGIDIEPIDICEQLN